MFELVKRMAAEFGVVPETLFGAGTVPVIDVTPQELSVEKRTVHGSSHADFALAVSAHPFAAALLCHDTEADTGPPSAARCDAGTTVLEKATSCDAHHSQAGAPHVYSKLRNLRETGLGIMGVSNRHWLDYDFVTVAVLIAGLGIVEIFALSI